MRLQSQLCDVTVWAGGQKFHCHQAVLAASSGHFHSIFVQGVLCFPKKPTNETLDLSFISAEVFSIILDYIYTANIHCPTGIVADVLQAAKTLEIEPLTTQLPAFVGGATPISGLNNTSVPSVSVEKPPPSSITSSVGGSKLNVPNSLAEMLSEQEENTDQPAGQSAMEDVVVKQVEDAEFSQILDSMMSETESKSENGVGNLVDYFGAADTSDDSGDEGDQEEEQEESSSDNSDDDDDDDDNDDDNNKDGADSHGVWMPIIKEDPGPDPIPFTAVPGIKHPPPQDSKPIDYFNLFFTANIVAKIVYETNRYAQQWIVAHRDYLLEKQRSVVHQWQKIGQTTAEEFRAFLGVALNMGLVKKSTMSSYWDRAHKCQATPWFTEHFSRDRFELLLKFLHFNNIARQPPPADPAHKLYKIKPIVEHFNRVFLHHYHPGMDISINESSMGFRDQAPHPTQFKAQKRHAKFGKKLWCVCDSLTGYTSFFEVYTGRDSAAPADPHGSMYAMVMRLMTACDFLHCGHHVGIDNFLSCPDLFFDLYKQGTTATGTVRSDRKGLPQPAVNQKIKNNQTAERRKGPLLCVVYKDGSKFKQPVVLLSTAVAGGSQAVVTQKGRQVQRPKVVVKFSKAVGGVDLGDATLTNLSDRRTMKWTNKVFFAIFGRAVLNSFVLYDQHSSDNPKLSRHQFMLQLVESLAGSYFPPNAVRPPRRTPSQIRQDREMPNVQGASAQVESGTAGGPGGQHWPRKLPKGRLRNCVAGHPTRTRSSYECPACNVGLCIKCFPTYHER
ncbi:piggyBac transposable element-derived protein 4-like [Branchiostoma floridae]|uniref:PiggyBac transposable element-derived protein 4-like n=1 Tax=Branchiostoma floridae TaxID=7739 RepID=A0A9J7MM15_BRAFL|nr:piggyBac transposable element-derived protein 4-like [Branchiostoma floridae]